MIRNRIGFLWESDVLLHYKQAARTHQESSFWPVVVVVMGMGAHSLEASLPHNDDALFLWENCFRRRSPHIGQNRMEEQEAIALGYFGSSSPSLD